MYGYKIGKSEHKSASGNIGIARSFLSDNIATDSDEEGQRHDNAESYANMAAAAAPGVTDVENSPADAAELDGVVWVTAVRKGRPKCQILRSR